MNTNDATGIFLHLFATACDACATVLERHHLTADSDLDELSDSAMQHVISAVTAFNEVTHFVHVHGSSIDGAVLKERDAALVHLWELKVAFAPLAKLAKLYLSIRRAQEKADKPVLFIDPPCSTGRHQAGEKAVETFRRVG